MLPVVDIFAGVGGLSLGACRAGFELRLAVDNDSHALRAHALNFPSALHSASNVLDLSGAELLREAALEHGQLAGLIGGPPCQGFSRIGRRNISDPRNSLFAKFFVLVREMRPKFYLAENVPGILDEGYDSLRAEALAPLCDYEQLEPFTVRASDYGAPTNRERVLFVGYRKGDFSENLVPGHFASQRDDLQMCVRDALAGLPTKIKDGWLHDEEGWRLVRRRPTGPFWDRVFGYIPKGVGDAETVRKLKEENRVSGCVATNHTAETRARFAKLKTGGVDSVSRGRRLDPFGLCPTIRAGTAQDKGSYQAVRPIHPSEHRVITPREAARLQGFPDWFRFAPSKWHSFRQIGNSVSPILAEAILKVLKDRLITPVEEIERRAA